MKQKQYLLDTCICAYWLRDKRNVREHINAVGFDNCYISEMTIAELKYGKAYGQLKGGPKYREQPLKEFFEAIKVLPVAPSSTSMPRRKPVWHWLARPRASSTC